jgi:lipopolysaccharide export system protein LptA
MQTKDARVYRKMKFSSRTFLSITAFIFGIIIFQGPSALAQKKVHLKHADVLKRGGKGDERFERLVGNVILVQNATTIYSDSAHLYKKRNSVEAFGHVHIVEGDSIDITGSRLEYDGNTKKAKLRNKVVFTKLATATLYTDNLDFSRLKNLAYYFNGGKLVDTTNTLTSVKGYYNTISNLASFKKDVHVTNPDYTMESDSLQYNSRTKIIYFVTDTKVVDKDSSTFVYNKGFYDTKTKVSDVKKGTGESEQYTIVGDDYDFDGISNVGKVRGNVVMTSKKENLQIHGQASDYFKARGVSKVYNGAYVSKVTEDNDTLFMTADTLVSIDNEDESKKRILAYHNVKIYKKDMQGLADSLEYRPSDSTIYFYKKPVLWSEGNQMTADTIRMLIQHNTISKVYLVANAFVIAQDTLKNYNQIKGRKMTAELANSKIHRVMVTGNGETLYHALTEDNKALMGVNKSVSSKITIRFVDGKVNNLSFYVKPDAKFIPPHELKKDEMTLKGFEWKGDEKPLREDVVRDAVKSPPKTPGENKPAKKTSR